MRACVRACVCVSQEADLNSDYNKVSDENDHHVDIKRKQNLRQSPSTLEYEATPILVNFRLLTPHLYSFKNKETAYDITEKKINILIWIEMTLVLQTTEPVITASNGHRERGCY